MRDRFSPMIMAAVPQRADPGRANRVGSHVGHSTKSLRDSPLRGAGELIKLNPLAPSKATSARSLTWIEESNAT